MGPNFTNLLVFLFSWVISTSVANKFAQHGEPCLKLQGGHPCLKTTSTNIPTGLTCINAKCQCESPRHQIFNKELNICQSKAGGFCTNSTQHSCIKQATCELIGGTTSGICVCKKGMSPNRGGKCVGEYEASCLTNSHCSSKLVCREERCGCRDSVLQIYHPYFHVCQSVAGAMCSEHDSCIDGAICRSADDSSHRESFRTCQCQESYRQVGRKCVAHILFILGKAPVM